MTTALQAFFDPPSFGYNLSAFILGFAGVALGVWALVIAYREIGKVLTATQASTAATERTRRELERIGALVEVLTLTGYTREILSALRADDFAAAAYRSQDLRAGIAQLQASGTGVALTTLANWQSLLLTVATTQRNLQSFDGAEWGRPELKQQCLAAIQDVDEQLHALKSGATKLTGEGHAHS